jgi:hypothetical protein
LATNPTGRLRATSIAPRAKAWLAETKQAHILYAFERVINIVNQESEVLTLSSSVIGNGPFSLVLEPGDFPSDIEASAPVLAFDNGLWLGDWLIDAENAQSWSPMPNWDAMRGYQSAHAWAGGILATLLTEHAEADSLARLVLDPVATSPLPARILQAAEQNIPLLWSGIQNKNIASLKQAAKGLGGIGPGLTPAGDDLLLGVMHGLWATLQPNQAQSFGSLLANAAIPRTHALSAAWLQAGASGEAAEPWHALVAAIAARDEIELRSAAMAILPTGHTSGSDALGGFLGNLRLSV